MDSVQDYGVVMISPEVTVVSWSKAAERLKGYRPEAIIGVPLSVFFPPDELAKGTVDRLLQRARTDGRGEYEGWLVRKDGSMFWGDLMLSAVRDAEGQLRGSSDVCRNLTERNRQERAQTF